MMEKHEGKIINICSMMSELGRETVSAYAAAKGALKMLTKNIASEYGEYNIQCNGMGPGYIATAQTAPLREVQPDGSRHPFDQFITAKTPAGRWGDPEDMVGPCVFLASHASDFVNGQILYADGGILAYIGRQLSKSDNRKALRDAAGLLSCQSCQIRMPPQWSSSCWMISAVQPEKVLMRDWNFSFCHCTLMVWNRLVFRVPVRERQPPPFRTARTF